MNPTSRNLRVCLVSFEFPPSGGGEATYTYNLVRGLSSRGHSVCLVVPRRRTDELPPLPKSTKVYFVKTKELPLLKVLDFLVAVRCMLPDIIKKERIDLTHFTFDYPSYPINFNGAGTALLATVHHLHFVEAINMVRFNARSLVSPYFAKQFLLTKVEQNFIRPMEKVIAVSEFTRLSLLQIGVESDRVRVIHNGIDAKPFTDSDGALFRGRLNLRGNDSIVLYVGRLEPSKGLEYLLSAFGPISRDFPDARLVLVGRGSVSYTAALKRSMVAQSADRVVFAGYVDSEVVRSGYAASSVVVLPSLMEGMGITLVEAMAASKPCIASRVGGVPEIVTNGETGLLVPPADVESLASGIAEVLGDRPRAAAMGVQASRLVRQRFTIEEMSAKTESAYLEALEDWRSSRL